MTDNYVASTIEISINQFFEKYIESKTVTFYKLEIYDNYSKERWELDKRYSEIDYLHKTLTKLYPNIPPMPGKTLFKIKNRDSNFFCVNVPKEKILSPIQISKHF